MSAINHIRLSDLNKQIEDVINNNFNNLSFWIIADITEHSFKEKTGYHFFHFVEKDINSNKLLAKIAGKAWGSGSSRIKDFERHTGQKFTNNINVLIKVKVVYHVEHGLSLDVIDIDTNYTVGLIPRWAKDNKISNNTLNARYETLEEKPSFRDSINKRCIVIADGIYDWQDVGKNKKQCFYITQPNNSLFSLAGLYSIWKNPVDNKTIKSFTIVTTIANPVFQKIHNYCEDDRMLFMLTKEQEQAWLNGENLEANMDIPLIASPVPSVLKKQ